VRSAERQPELCAAGAQPLEHGVDRAVAGLELVGPEQPHVAVGGLGHDAGGDLPGGGPQRVVTLVEVHGVELQAEARALALPLRLGPEQAVGDVAQRAVGRPDPGADPVAQFTHQVAVGVVDADEADHGRGLVGGLHGLHPATLGVRVRRRPGGRGGIAR
jgi:hypothetical protein